MLVVGALTNSMRARSQFLNQCLRATVAEPAVPIAHPQSRGVGRLWRARLQGSCESNTCESWSSTGDDGSLTVDPSDHSSAPLDPGAQPSPFWRLASRRAAMHTRAASANALARSALPARSSRPKRAAHSIGWRDFSLLSGVCDALARPQSLAMRCPFLLSGVCSRSRSRFVPTAPVGADSATGGSAPQTRVSWPSCACPSSWRWRRGNPRVVISTVSQPELLFGFRF